MKSKSRKNVQGFSEPQIKYAEGYRRVWFEFINPVTRSFEKFVVKPDKIDADEPYLQQLCKNTQKALRREYFPPFNKKNGTFKSHIIREEEINYLANLSWYTLFMFTIDEWIEDKTLRIYPLPKFVFIAGWGVQLNYLLNWITRGAFTSIIEKTIITIGALALAFFLLIREISASEREEDDLKMREKLPIALKDRLNSIFYVLLIEAIAVGGWLFFTK